MIKTLYNDKSNRANWLCLMLYCNFYFLIQGQREFLRDYALPVAVVVFSLIGSVLFSDVALKYFSYQIPGTTAIDSSENHTHSEIKHSRGTFEVVDFQSLRVADVFGAMGLGFSLSLLFFMDQNIRYTKMQLWFRPVADIRHSG